MKRHLASLLAALTLTVAAQPALHAASKADKERAALVAALQAVSPDPLGGRLGLEVASRNAAAQASAPVTRTEAPSGRATLAKATPRS